MFDWFKILILCIFVAVKCSSVGSCLVFMPRIDLWAIETLQQVNGIDSSLTNSPPSSSNESTLAESMDFQGPSHAWSSFVEQVESLSVTTTVMILVQVQFIPCLSFMIFSLLLYMYIWGVINPIGFFPPIFLTIAGANVNITTKI